MAHEVFGQRRFRHRPPVHVAGVEHHRGLAVVATVAEQLSRRPCTVLTSPRLSS